MTSIIFVHGTGGRGKAYADTFAHIEQTLDKLQPELNLVPCLWGDLLGTRLKASGASVPDYNSTGGKANSEQDYSIELWEQLYQDPLYEIRLLSLNPSKGPKPFDDDPWKKLKNKVNELATSYKSEEQLKRAEIEELKEQLKRAEIEELKEQLKKAEIAEVFKEAHKLVTGDRCEPFSNLLKIIPGSLDDCYLAISRAMVAQAIILQKQKGNYPRILFDGELRDQIVKYIYEYFTEKIQGKGFIGDFIKNYFLKTIKKQGNKQLQEERGNLTDKFYPFIGDIILYQAKGEKIREFIKKEISKIDTPVVLLAHSLGGIACVDLLIKHNLPQVKLLITVGSQSPFFYELDALKNLSYSETLPEHFPKWLNIYDVRDILSYIGNREGLFPGRVKDVQVDNQQPFPEVHSAYWYNQSTWDIILQKISEISE